MTNGTFPKPYRKKEKVYVRWTIQWPDAIVGNTGHGMYATARYNGQFRSKLPSFAAVRMEQRRKDKIHIIIISEMEIN